VPNFDELSEIITKLNIEPIELVRQKEKYGLTTIKTKQ